MRVGVQRQHDRGVAQPLAHHLRVLVGDQQQRRAGVPQVVEPERRRQPRPLQRILCDSLCDNGAESIGATRGEPDFGCCKGWILRAADALKGTNLAVGIDSGSAYRSSNPCLPGLSANLGRHNAETTISGVPLVCQFSHIGRN